MSLKRASIAAGGDEIYPYKSLLNIYELLQKVPPTEVTVSGRKCRATQILWPAVELLEFGACV